MATWRGNQRQYLDSIGIEADSNFDVDDGFNLVISHTDSLRALGAIAGTHGWFSALAPAFAGVFGGVELLAPAEGMWLSVLNGSGNNFEWRTFGPRAAAAVLTANFGLIGYANYRSNGVAANSSLGGSAAIDPNTLLPIARVGTAAASLGNSSLLGSAQVLLDQPLWVPPMCTFAATINVANTAGFLHCKVYVANEARG